MKNKQLLSKKFLIIASILIISLYSIFWIVIEQNVEKLKKLLALDNQNWKITYQDARLTGFPFKYKINIKDLKITYNNKLLNFKLETHLDSISAETGILFNSLTITLPKKVVVDTYYQAKYNKWALESFKESQIHIKEANLVNTFKVIDLILDPKSFDEQTYSISQFAYNYNECHFYNLNINKEIFNSDAYFKINFKDKAKNILKVFVDSKNNLKFIDHEFLGHEFNNATYNLDLSLSLKKTDNNYSQVPLINVHLAELSIDDFKLVVNGDIKSSNNSGFNLNLSINISKFDSFIDKLVKQKLISLAKKDIIDNMMHKISGNNDLSKLNLKAYTSKNSSIRVGEVDGPEIQNYIEQLRNID